MKEYNEMVLYKINKILSNPNLGEDSTSIWYKLGMTYKLSNITFSNIKFNLTAVTDISLLFSFLRSRMQLPNQGSKSPHCGASGASRNSKCFQCWEFHLDDSDSSHEYPCFSPNWHLSVTHMENSEKQLKQRPP